MDRLYEYGPGPSDLLVDEAEARHRLDMLLHDKLLNFNPYSVDDRTLLDCAFRGRWLPFPAVTQMVIVHFDKISYRIPGVIGDYVTLRIGNAMEVIRLPIRNLITPSSYIATLRPIRPQLNDRNITTLASVEAMLGKSYFVSHMLTGKTANGSMTSAYRFYLLHGSLSTKAEQIRQRMIQSKITMLREIIAYPYCQSYLRCRRNLFDYETHILSAIDAISRYPDHPL